MNRILVWDIPTRLFHWTFAASIAGSLGIAFLVDDDNPLFQMHMLLGIVALFLLLPRLVMGIAGSRYARFSSYPVRPREAAAYLIAALTSKTKRYPGNNPGSALAALLMFLLVLVLFLSGIGWGGEAMEELHEPAAWAMLVVVVLHLAGIAWHTIRHKENIAVSMLHGKKQGDPVDGIPSAHPAWGLAMLLACAGWITALFANHNSRAATVTLPGIGTTLQLGENESGEEEHSDGHAKKNHDDDD